MLSGEITAQNGDTYNLTLADGQIFKVPARCLPEALQSVGQKVNLLFGGAEATGIEASEARALVNSLLSGG